MPNVQLLAVLYMVLSMTSYQISASFAKQLFLALDPITVTILRLCFAAIIVCVMFRSWKVIRRLHFLKWRDLLCYSASSRRDEYPVLYVARETPARDCSRTGIYWPLGLALISIQNRKDYVWVLLAILGIVLMVPWGSQ